MSTPEHVAMIEATVARQRAFFQTGATRPVAVRVAPCTNSSGRCRPGRPSSWTPLRRPAQVPRRGVHVRAGPEPGRAGLPGPEAPPVGQAPAPPHPLAQFCSSSYQLAELRGGAGDVPLELPLPAQPRPPLRAIAAGNCVVLKPSAYAPNTSRAMAELIAAVFPPDWVTVIQGGREQNAALLEQKFDYIFFTGSVDVGKMVMEKASRHLTPVTLELGGKSPCIVDKTASLKLAARRIVFGKYLNCGQTCVAPDYILCHESVREELIRQITAQIKLQFGENPLKNENYGHIINQKHFHRILGLIEKEKVVWGGQAGP